MTAGHELQPQHQQDGKLLTFTGRVAVITGAARGLGREYALLLASRGAAVVVNDLGGGRDGSGGGSAAADEVVAEITRAGGAAVADYHSVEEGHKIVQTAIEKFGRIDILINNAGILRDRSMMKITEEDWDLVHRVHLRGAFLTTRAAWPHFRDQQYGRILMTSSPSGLYGNFGQANYSSAKLGLLSLAKTLAVEGAKYNIRANTIIPVAASRLTEDLLPEDLLELFAPRYVAPMVALLVHEACPANGEVFEAAGGFYGRYQWQRSAGKVFSEPSSVTPEAIRDAWHEVVDIKLGKGSSSPSSMAEHTFKLISQLRGEEVPEAEGEEVGDIIVEDQRRSSSVVVSDEGDAKTLLTTITPQDVILYALSVGVSTSDPFHLQYLYEADEHFTALPTLAASLSLNAVFETNLFQEAITRYGLEDNFIKTLHGEQYLKLLKPIPTAGQLVSKPRIVDVLDKGSGALILIEVPTYNTAGELLFLNQLALFMIGSGGFEGGKRTSDYPGLVEAVEVPSDRPPDAVVRQVTSVDQAATFRLVGDSNPLHIDPAFSVIGGFERPILHGLCLLGFAVRAALREFAGGSSVDAEVEATAFDAAKASNPSSQKVKIDAIFGDGKLREQIRANPSVVASIATTYQFNISLNGAPVSVWTLDLKNAPGDIYRGPLEKGSPDCVLTVEDQVIADIFTGKEDALKAFMNGHLKVTGNILAASKLQQLFADNLTKGADEEDESSSS
ncbi:PREDICTED: peroxisomal multifunctional enzyme type 2-like, partial [Rhagoletis zephyria]|uniref:peroxisomal multifunctional enzyme type 2-like n=1 Tax=Rhagoletis zephyria TaxID=28612 RepID=UPI00081157CB